MSYAAPAAPKSTSRVSRFASAVRRNWTEARYADRQLMALRTNLSRHSGEVYDDGDRFATAIPRRAHTA